MDQKPSLDALKIHRAEAPPSDRRWLWIGLVVIVLVIAAGAGWYFLAPPSAISVHAATAQSLSSGGASSLDASGYVVARRQATLSSKIQGLLIQENIEEGQRVKAGEVVARLDDSNARSALMTAEANQNLAQAALENAAAIYDRYKHLHDQNAVSQDALQNQKTLYDAARNGLEVAKATVVQARAAESDTFVRAPYDGVVTDKVAQVGEIVAPAAAGGGSTRTGIATLVDMDSLEVDVDVSENYIERVHAGEAATVHLDAYPDWDIPASVIAVVPTADQTKGTVKARIAIKAKDSRILPQMGARVSFFTQAEGPSPTAHGVTLPLDAVKANGHTGTVYLIQEDGTIEERAVSLGLKTSDTITVLSGLSAGDRVAHGDLGQLHDGEKVSVSE